VLLYYITDRRQFAGTPEAQRRALLGKIADAARAGVDYIQLREKDLSACELEQLAREAVAALSPFRPATNDQRPTTRLLINSRADVALAVGADGVHLPAADLSASEVRALWGSATRNSQLATRNCLLGVSCHSSGEVSSAESHAADFAVFGPVFEKAGETPSGKPGAGLAALRAACARGARNRVVPRTEAGYATAMPVLALGGVTLANARECLRAGAAGVAGIRLFQDGDVARVVAELRALG
jgi:thiamine-phosphate pyrophosphorylase